MPTPRGAAPPLADGRRRGGEPRGRGGGGGGNAEARCERWRHASVRIQLGIRTCFNKVTPKRTEIKGKRFTVLASHLASVLHVR